MKFLEHIAAPDNVSISDLIHKALTIVDPPRPFHGVPHASDLTNQDKFCPRELVLAQHLKKMTYPRKIEAPMKITFDEGRDKQARLNNEWLRPIMVGFWACRSCLTLSVWGKAPKWCSCNYPKWQYVEPAFNHPFGLVGSTDAILDVGKAKLRAVEFKIIDKDQWIELKAPLAEHRVRSKLYLELIAADQKHPAYGQIDSERIHVLYCMRGFGKKDPAKNRLSPFKEFIVHRDPVEADLYLKMAMAVKRARDLDWEYFPKGICETMFDKRCAKCTVPKECFSGNYPAAFEW